jgi:hypothetical protein
LQVAADRAARKHLGDFPATSAKQARAPIPPDARTFDDTAMREFGETQVSSGTLITSPSSLV